MLSWSGARRLIRRLSWSGARRLIRRASARHNTLPSLSPNSTPLEAAETFRRTGCLLIPDLLPANKISALREVYLDRYRSYLTSDGSGDALVVGDRRYMITIDLKDPFFDPEIYANPAVIPILKQLLGDALVLGSFASVTSLPGARMQHFHRDTEGLFSDALDGKLPTYAVTVFLPLREFNETNGTTRVLPGSHVQIYRDGRECPAIDPTIPVGGALLVDYRLIHQGTANHSTQPRPMLYAVYHRPWFKDYLNYRNQPFLKLSADDRARIPEAHRNMFRWVGHYETGLY